jgi:peptidoglycan/xylan/chitin deacetylase (PgdA/CDA1 family)
MNGLALLIPFLLLVAASSQAAPVGDSINTTQIANITRLQASQLPYGAVLTHCTVPGTIALTFDDGPYIYTAQILDTLAQHGARATFFLNGHNKGSIDAFPQLVQRAWGEGHQLGSHTYVIHSLLAHSNAVQRTQSSSRTTLIHSYQAKKPMPNSLIQTHMYRYNHLSLDTLPYPEIIHQMTTLEETFTRILGFFPTYMRPPFLRHTPVVLTAMADLRYHVIGASVDTKDYEHDDPDTNWVSFEKFRREVDAGGSIVLAHDAHRYTVELLVKNMLEEVERRGLIRMFFSFFYSFLWEGWLLIVVL